MIEEEYDVIIDALAIVPENFISVESIANVIRKHGERYETIFSGKENNRYVGCTSTNRNKV